MDGCGYQKVCENVNRACTVHDGGPEYECYKGPMCPRATDTPKCVNGECEGCNAILG